MKVSEIIRILNAKVLCCGDMVDSLEINSACGCDMMSDVLAFVKDQGMLITGLINPQVVRTAEMMDMSCIVFVRGKVPDQTVIELASEKKIMLLTTNCRMYSACGLLYNAGLDAGKGI